MVEQKLEIKYRCLHQSCQIKNCREGVLNIEESLFNQLSASYDDKTLFKSPRGICRMGFPQTFKILNMATPDSALAAREEGKRGEEVMGKGGPDPIEIFKEEHQVVLKNLDLIEEQMHERDIDGLWITTAEVENEIALHSIEKEESILFPLLEKASPLLISAIAIIKEDHRELIALLHSFRDGLREGDILDGVAHSVISNLRSHISKEDNEFFEMVNSCLDAERKKCLLEGMAKAEKSHIAVEPGDRCKEPSDEKGDASSDRERFNEAFLAAKKAKDDECCH